MQACTHSLFKKWHYFIFLFCTLIYHILSHMSEIIPSLKHKTYSIFYSCKRFHCLCIYILFDRPAIDGCWDHFLCVVLLQCCTEPLCMCVCPQVHVDPHDGLFTLVDTDRHYKLYHWFIQQIFMSICLLCRCGWILSFRVKKMDTKFHIQNEPKCVQKHIHTEAHTQVRDVVPTLQALSVCIRTDRCAYVGGRSIQQSLAYSRCLRNTCWMNQGGPKRQVGEFSLQGPAELPSRCGKG